MSKDITSSLQLLTSDLMKEIDRDTTAASERNTPCPLRSLDILQSIADITQTSLVPLYTTTNDAPSSKSADDERKKPASKAPQESLISIELLDETKAGKSLTKALKYIRRIKRKISCDDSVSSQQWQDVMEYTNELLSLWKKKVQEQEKKEKTSIAKDQNKSDESTGIHKSSQKNTYGNDPNLPSSSAEYRVRLATQKKEMYKDPPAMPPPQVIVESEICGPPKRNKNGELVFSPSAASMKDRLLVKLIDEFRPNRTPEEVLRSGSFGGTYYRPIVSAVTNQKYKSSEVLNSSIDSKWIDGLDKGTMITSSTYRNNVNKYKVKCGGSLGMWESSGWISDTDPYGWFQWYCRFYQGRRCSDDARQIGRWMKCAGPRGRFLSQLCNKCIAAAGQGNVMSKVQDVSISPVIRQTLLHWGLGLTEHLLTRHGKRTGKL